MRMSARSMVKTTVIAILTALAALVIGVMQSLTTAVTASIGLTAVRAIIVPGTGTPDPYVPNNYLNNAMNYYVNPGGDCGAQPGPATDCPPSLASSTTPRSGRSLCPDGEDSKARSGTCRWGRASSIWAMRMTRFLRATPSRSSGTRGRNGRQHLQDCAPSGQHKSSRRAPDELLLHRGSASVRRADCSNGSDSWAMCRSSTHGCGRPAARPIPATAATRVCATDFALSTTASPTSRSGWPTLLPSGTRSPASSTSTAPTWRPTATTRATETPYGYTPKKCSITSLRRRRPTDAPRRITASTSTAATPSTSRCQPGICRCISRSSTSATRPAPRR